MTDDPESSDLTPSERPAPILDYRRPIPPAPRIRRPRRTVPPPLGIGFTCAAGCVAVAWMALDVTGLFVPHMASYLALGMTITGFGFTAFSGRPRLAGAGILIAVGLWFLLLGACAGIGFVRPLVF